MVETGATVKSKRVQVNAHAPQAELGSRLQVREQLDEGGMGFIREVFDNNLARNAAMKVLKPEHSDDDLAVRRFLEEAQITAQLDHPNIVPVHELGVDPSGALYFTMKLVRGQTLTSILQQQDYQKREERELYAHLQIFLKVCDAVAFAHSRGVLHRDLKPDNIMVGEFGEVYLMDWGIARLLQQEPTEPPPEKTHRAQTKVGSILGTLSYMAPEQARGKSEWIDERTDVFSLGAILYEILTQAPPYIGITNAEVARKAALGDIVSPQEFVDIALPPALCAIAVKALDKARSRRHQTVAELSQEIQNFLQSGWNFPKKHFAAGDHIVVEGEIGSEAFIILKGTCQVYKTVQQTRTDLKVLHQGDVFGEIAVITAKPRSASVVALDDVTVATVTQKYFEDELGMAHWLGVFVKALAERFRELDARAIQLEQMSQKRKG